MPFTLPLYVEPAQLMLITQEMNLLEPTAGGDWEMPVQEGDVGFEPPSMLGSFGNVEWEPSSSSDKTDRNEAEGLDLQDLAREAPSRLKNKKYAVDKNIELSAK